MANISALTRQVSAVRGTETEECSSIEEQIENSKRHWTHLPEPGSISAEEVEETDEEVFQRLQLHPDWGDFFYIFRDSELVVAEEKFAEGGQAEIYAAQIRWRNSTPSQEELEDPWKWVVKVFKQWPLRDLQKQWPKGMLQFQKKRCHAGLSRRYNCDVVCGTLLKDGSFAFLMQREKEDLRTLIDRNMKGMVWSMWRKLRRCGPFSMEVAASLMYEIACGMEWLHDHDIVHRDLKAANVLVRQDGDQTYCFVADYECSVGTVGTNFFRAPEILQALKDKSVSKKPEIFSKEVDIYSYGMTCYEILTGKLPFEGEKPYNFDVILKDRHTLQVPNYVDNWMHKLLRSCWEYDPKDRPTFTMIKEQLSENSKASQGNEDIVNSRYYWSQLMATITMSMLTEEKELPSTLEAEELPCSVEEISAEAVDEIFEHSEAHNLSHWTVLAEQSVIIGERKLPIEGEELWSTVDKIFEHSEARSLSHWTVLAEQSVIIEEMELSSTLEAEELRSTVDEISAEEVDEIFEHSEAHNLSHRTVLAEQSVIIGGRELLITFEAKELRSTVDEIFEHSKAHSLSHWTVLAEQSGIIEDEVVAEYENVRVFKDLQLHPIWGRFFCTFGYDTEIYERVGELELGAMIGEGAQAKVFGAHITWANQEINEYDVKNKRQWVLKVYEMGTWLRDLQLQFPKGMLRFQGERLERMELAKQGATFEWEKPINVCDVVCGTLLEDGRFANLLEREQGDLRELIDFNMRLRSGYDCGPFYKAVAEEMMHGVALGMDWLHSHDIVLRDLKAANVLITEDRHGKYHCSVCDYEFSLGVVGSGFWRAPEILQAVKDKNVSRRPELFSRAVDVYGYAMTCYEVLTGEIPFEGRATQDYDAVINGLRPELPKYVDDWARELLSKCWHSDPAARPSFGEILEFFEERKKASEESPR
jgi:serine/threonine protein kinase